MKRIFLKPLVVMTVASFTMFGCSSSTETTATTAMDSTTMSESASMGGNVAGTDANEFDVLVIEEKVLVPVATLSVTALAMENPEKVNDMFESIEDTEQYDVLALARQSPNLSTFVRLLEQANLVDDLQRVEKVTLFAPTNEAFAKMPKEKLEALLAPENTALLSSTLQAHILASEVSSVQLENNSRIRVGENSFIPIESGAVGTNIRVGGAQIVMSDVEASNGRIHVVDKLILPGEDFREDTTK